MFLPPFSCIQLAWFGAQKNLGLAQVFLSPRMAVWPDYERTGAAMCLVVPSLPARMFVRTLSPRTWVSLWLLISAPARILVLTFRPALLVTFFIFILTFYGFIWLLVIDVYLHWLTSVNWANGFKESEESSGKDGGQVGIPLAQ